MTSTVADLNLVHPLECAVVAQVRQECANLTWFYDHGYIRYYDGTQLMLREHQRVAVAAYGVPSGFHVHHVNANRLDNRADNLVVLSPSEHMRITASRLRSDRVTVKCAVCGATFQTTTYRAIERGKRFCSDDCRLFAQRRVDRPSCQYLAELIATVNNWCEIGRMFGVTDNSVRKWARSYGLL